MIDTMAYFLNLTTYAIISSENLNAGNTLLSMNRYSDFSIMFNSYSNLSFGAYNVLDAYGYNNILIVNSVYFNFTQCINSEYDAIN